MPKQNLHKPSKAVIRNLRQAREAEILASVGENIGLELEIDEIDYSNFPLPFNDEKEDNKNYYH